MKLRTRALEPADPAAFVDARTILNELKELSENELPYTLRQPVNDSKDVRGKLRQEAFWHHAVVTRSKRARSYVFFVLRLNALTLAKRFCRVVGRLSRWTKSIIRIQNGIEVRHLYTWCMLIM